MERLFLFFPPENETLNRTNEKESETLGRSTLSTIMFKSKSKFHYTSCSVVHCRKDGERKLEG